MLVTCITSNDKPIAVEEQVWYVSPKILLMQISDIEVFVYSTAGNLIESYRLDWNINTVD